MSDDEKVVIDAKLLRRAIKALEPLAEVESDFDEVSFSTHQIDMARRALDGLRQAEGRNTRRKALLSVLP